MKHEAVRRLLPEVFQRTAENGTPLAAMLLVMEALHAPAEETLLNLSGTIDPRSAPETFLPYLSRWVNLDWLFEPMLEDWSRDTRRPVPYPPGVGSMRELIALGFRLNQESGTARGLLLFMETATGVAGYSLEEDPRDDEGRSIPFHFCVWAPEAARPYEPMLHRIIQFEKPAHVTYKLAFK